MKKIVILFSIIINTIFCFSQNNEYHINIENIKADVEFLSSDLLEGRGTATRGEDLSSFFLKNQLKKIGVKPYLESGDYLQPFELKKKTISDESFIMINNLSNNQTNVFKYKEDFYMPYKYINEVDMTKEIVFAGYGIDSKELGRNDYLDIDVNDKIVVVLNGIPNSVKSKNEELIKFHSNSIKSKWITAQTKGAAGILVVSDSLISNTFNYEFIDEIYYQDNQYIIDADSINKQIPMFFISPEMFSNLVGTRELSPEKIMSIMHDETETSVLNLETEARLNIKKTEQIEICHNVIGKIEGNDPLLKNEYVVIGGHFDHLGIKANKIYNGADDNATGVSAILEISRELLKTKQNKRSVIICFFTAEEIGLYGSQEFVKTIKDPESIKAFINLDMIGRSDDNSIDCYGNSNYNKEIKELIKNSKKDYLKVNYYPAAVGASDHLSFLYKDIPSICFYDGMKDDFHTPKDEINKVNFEKVEKVTKLTYDLLLESCNSIGSFPSERSKRMAKEIYKGTFYKNFNSSDFIGREIKITAQIKTELENDSYFLFWLFSINNNNSQDFDFIETMESNSEWKKYTIYSGINNNSNLISIGFELNGKGIVLVDDVKVSIKNDNNEWEQYANACNDFENKLEEDKWEKIEEHCTIDLHKKDSFEGNSSITIKSL